jgi:PhnB protein
VARVSIYLNFEGETEQAFEFYRQVFGGEFVAFQRMGEVPPDPDRPPLPQHERQLVMHVELAILGGTLLMGTDVLESMGSDLRFGTNVSINLEPDSYEQGRPLFDALSEGARDVMPLQPMFWGDHFGTIEDRFGVRWMMNCPAP